jgi:hypothetical protein
MFHFSTILSIVILSYVTTVEAFHLRKLPHEINQNNLNKNAINFALHAREQRDCRSCCSRTGSVRLSIKPEWFSSGDEDDDEDDDELVTREMLQRDLLGQDPLVKRKRKSKNSDSTSYKPLDNRDNLPFNVKLVTPDPYTHPERKIANAQRAKSVKKTDLDHQLTPSRLYQQKKNNKTGGIDTSTFLGDFKLDKSTTSGDVIVIGEREFEVQTARSQYKYAGGRRFMMVRKILEVKEVSRVAKEEFLTRQFQQSEDWKEQGPPELD